MPLGVRRNSSSPNSLRSLASELLTAGCEMPRFSATFDTRRSTRNWSKTTSRFRSSSCSSIGRSVSLLVIRLISGIRLADHAPAPMIGRGRCVRPVLTPPCTEKETRMSDPSTIFPSAARWEREETSRIPFVAYTSDDLYKRELERFFYKGHWCYVG